MEPALKRIPLLAFRYTMPEGYLEKVVSFAVTHQKEVSQSVRKQLNDVLREKVQIKGFRDPTVAPQPLLLKEIVKRFGTSEELFGALLQVWILSHAELEEIVRKFLAARQISTLEVTEIRSGLLGAWSWPSLSEMTEEFCAEHPEYDRGDVSLMLCCLTGRAPIREEEKKTEEASQNESQSSFTGERSGKWRQWLEELQRLPAEAPEWEEAAAFLDALRQLCEAKRQEREASRSRLQCALDTLIVHCADELAFFDMMDVRAWAVEACPREAIPAVIEQVEQLQALLVNYRELRAQRATKHAEERLHRERLEQMEGQIAELCDHLVNMFPSSPIPSAHPETQQILTGEERRPEKIGSAELLAIPDVHEEQASATESTEQKITAAEDLPVSRLSPEAALTPATSGNKSVVVGRQLDVAVPQLREDEHRGGQPFVETGTEEPALWLPELWSIQEIASLLKKEDRPEYWHSLLWALITEDDLPVAYWLVQSLSAMGHTCFVPDWLLAAVQGARWLGPDSDAFVEDLLAITRSCQPHTNEEQKLLGLAAALRSTLVAPGSGLMGWLVVPESCPALCNLVNAVKKFASWGKPLQPEDLLGVTSAEQRKATFEEAVREAREWLEEAPKRRTKMKRASDVWRQLVGLQGDVRALLLPVSEDRHFELDIVRENLRRLQNSEDIAKRINEIDRNLVGRKGREIVGGPRDQIVRDVKEARALAKRWCELVERERDIQARGDWFFRQVTELRTAVQKTLPEVEAALSELSSPAQPAPLVAVAHCLQRSIAQVSKALGLCSPDLDPDKWTWLARDTEKLPEALSRRLLWVPEIPLNDDGQVLPTALAQLAPTLRNAFIEGRTLRAAFERWLEQQDYRFIEVLLDALRDEADLSELSRKVQEQLEGSKATLRDDISRTRDDIERAVVDGISAEERSRYNSITEAIAPNETVNFSPRYAELQSIREQLAEARRMRLAEVAADWQKLQPRLAVRIEQAKWEQVRTFVQAAVDRSDTRVVEECVAHLIEVVESGGEIEEEWFTSPAVRDPFSEFMEALPRIESWLEREQKLHSLQGAVQSGRTEAGIKFGEVPTRRRDEAVNAIETWRRLKQQGAQGSDTLRSIPVLLRDLGVVKK